MKTISIIILMITAIISINSQAMAEDVLGCPKGIMQGTIWPRFDVFYADASQKFDFTTNKMVAIDSGSGLQKKTKTQFGFRLGYGLTTKMDIGILAKYTNVIVEKKKNNQTNQTDKSALTGLWLSSKYMILDSPTMKPFTYIKLSAGAGYKFPLCKDDDLIIQSVSNGATELKAGFLTHGGIESFDFAGHLLYWYRGKAKEIENTQGKPEYGKSGVELSDRINYMFKLEFDIHPVIGLGAGVTGWANLEKEETWQSNSWHKENFYIHKANLSLEIRPLGLDYEKRKLFCHLGIPYSAKNNITSDYTLKVGMMYTLY